MTPDIKIFLWKECFGIYCWGKQWGFQWFIKVQLWVFNRFSSFVEFGFLCWIGQTGERNSCTWGMLDETKWKHHPYIGSGRSFIQLQILDASTLNWKERKVKPDPSNCRISTLKQHNSSYDIASWKPVHSASLPFTSDQWSYYRMA